MAKNSAYSKGFRKNDSKEQKKAKVNRDTRIMIIGFAAIVIVFLCVLVLPDMIKDMQYLKLDGEGKIRGYQDGQLITNMSETSKKRYLCLGTVEGEPEGFTRVEDAHITDENVKIFTYEANDESSVAQKVQIQTGRGEPKAMLEQYLERFGAFFDVTYTGTIVEGEYNGKKTYSAVIEYKVNSSEDQENPIYEYDQSAITYMESNVADRCVLVNAMNSFDTDEAFCDRDAMQAICDDALALITLK